MSTKRFSNPDGVNAPEFGNWTIQETGANPGHVAGGAVFNTYAPDHTHTPANVPGWTVQSPMTGSDQNLTEHNGVHHG